MSEKSIMTHERIVARVQGRRDGWHLVLSEILKRAGEAFANSDDAKAHSLRDLARELHRHPLTLRMDEEEKCSLEVLERLKDA